MDRQRVSSSSIVSVGYDQQAAVLEVEFSGNRVYQYLDVPPEEFDELLHAESKGRYVNRVIKPAHRYRAT